jgi:hypothetical protein
MKNYRFHPLSEIFPVLQEEELNELADDIKERGLLAPVTLYQEKILDGRNRYMACRIAKVEPRFRECKGDPIAFVISANVLRRHLSASQRALAVAKLTHKKPGQPSKRIESNDSITRHEAAKLAGVGAATVERAKKVLDEGTPRHIEAVQSGEKNVAAVAAEIREKEKKREELTDSQGRVIPKEVREDWVDALRVGKEIRSAGLAWKRILDAHLNAGDKYKQRHNLSNRMGEDIGQLVYDISSHTIPYALCPFCQGLGKRCENCHSRGWISKSYWTSFVPEKLKKIIQTPTFGEG